MRRDYVQLITDYARQYQRHFRQARRRETATEKNSGVWFLRQSDSHKIRYVRSKEQYTEDGSQSRLPTFLIKNGGNDGKVYKNTWFA